MVTYLEAELCSFDGGDVAARTGTHHCDVCIDCKRDHTTTFTAKPA